MTHTTLDTETLSLRSVCIEEGGIVHYGQPHAPNFPLCDHEHSLPLPIAHWTYKAHVVTCLWCVVHFKEIP